MQPTVEAAPERTLVPRAGGLHHLSLTVTDIEASEDWYRRVLGLERVMVEQHEGGYAVVLNRPGTPLFIGLHHHARNGAERFDEVRTGLDHLAVHVHERAELDRWVGHLDRLGVPHGQITEATEPFPYALVVFRDPDNIQLELIWA
jgi:catechol 2,3-dioxygenase-like lactoylglutathione lyase family enzyme